MSTLKRLLIPALLAAASFATCFLVVLSPAPAADLKGAPVTRAEAEAANQPASWSGIYVGGAIGYGAADAAISSPGIGLDGLSGTGRIAGITVGADWQVPGSFLVLGARGGYNWDNVAFSVTPGIASASIDNGWSADARLGFAFGSAMPYIVAGYTSMKTSASFGGTALASPDIKGWRGGAGVEFKLPKIDTGTFLTPTVGLEVLYTDYNDLHFGSTTLNVTELSAMARLNLRFGR